jgi:hypothetical protein
MSDDESSIYVVNSGGGRDVDMENSGVESDDVCDRYYIRFAFGCTVTTNY